MRLHLALAALAAAISMTPLARAAEWQWSATVDAVTSSETNAHPRAFLWIPPNCERVRGVVVGQHNMQEEPILEHPAFRRTLADLGFAAVWVSPAFDSTFRFDRGAGEPFEAMMRSLAQVSGYAEIETAPVVPIGHSAMASYPHNFAAWKPERTLASISVSGQWPWYKANDQPDWTGKSIDGVPVLVTMGEYEAAANRGGEGARQRAEHPGVPMSFLGCAADGHFASLDDKVDFICLYLRKAAAYRLPKADGDKLTPIDPTKAGWLVDRYRQDAPPQAPAAPVGRYTGDAKQAFWWFDEEIAKAAESFAATNRGKIAPLVGYVQNGAIVPQSKNAHAQVILKWLPYGDGLTFRLSPAFLDHVPDGRPVGWTGRANDAPLPQPADASKIRIERICGPVVQVGPDTWAIRFYRMGLDNPKRTNDAWFVATYPGDDTFKRAVQQAQMRFPLTNKDGADQTITFDPIADRPTASGTMKLSATSSAGAPVHFYVREGPAEIDGDDTLRFTALPPRTKFPVKVTIVAWQWGRSIEPKLKSAMPVERTFQILGPGGTIVPAPAPVTFPTTQPAPPSTRPVR
jgi:hypothetical protein